MPSTCGNGENWRPRFSRVRDRDSRARSRKGNFAQKWTTTPKPHKCWKSKTLKTAGFGLFVYLSGTRTFPAPQLGRDRESGLANREAGAVDKPTPPALDRAKSRPRPTTYLELNRTLWRHMVGPPPRPFTLTSPPAAGDMENVSGRFRSTLNQRGAHNTPPPLGPRSRQRTQSRHLSTHFTDRLPAQPRRVPETREKCA